ncbi:MAG: NfeD family protein [Phormidesmis sp.]
MQWFNPLFPHMSVQMPASPLEELAIEVFTKSLSCRVTSAIYLHRFGRVTVENDGISWRAQLCETTGSAALLPGELAIAVGRQGNTLIVKPVGEPLL